MPDDLIMLPLFCPVWIFKSVLFSVNYIFNPPFFTPHASPACVSEEGFYNFALLITRLQLNEVVHGAVSPQAK